MDCGDWNFGGNGSVTCVRGPSEEAKEHQRECKEKGFETGEKPKLEKKTEKEPTK